LRLLFYTWAGDQIARSLCGVWLESLSISFVVGSFLAVLVLARTFTISWKSEQNDGNQKNTFPPHGTPTVIIFTNRG
jgi:hypothetical protein